MTIPVIPGPFAFTERIGEALGSFGRERERARLIREAAAQQDANLILQIVQQSGNPELLNQPGVRDVLGRAGVDAGILETILPLSAQQARAVSRLPPARREAALGIPSEAAVSATEAQARATGARAGIEAGELARVEPGGAAARAVAQVPPEQAAAATEQAAAATAEATKATAEATKAVQQEVSKRLADKTSDFSRWAAIASAGFLPLYLQRIASSQSITSSERERLSNRFRLLFEPLDNAASVWRQQRDQWLTRRDNFITLQNPNEKELADWLKTNPEPKFEDVQTEMIQAAAQQFFSGQTDPVGAYFAELDAITKDVDSRVLPGDRRVNIRRAAQMVVDGTVTEDVAEARIRATAPVDAEIDVVEFQTILRQLRGAQDTTQTPPPAAPATPPRVPGAGGSF